MALNTKAPVLEGAGHGSDSIACPKSGEHGNSMRVHNGPWWSIPKTRCGPWGVG
jgi:hypothetical protein